MGLAELVHVDAKDVARDLEIEVIELRNLPWLVSSVGDTVLFRGDVSGAVEQARIWEGIAQCLLSRLGVEWTATQAGALGAWLSSFGHAR